MALDLTAVRDGVASVLDGVAGLRPYARSVGQLQTPAAIVMPGDPYVDFEQAMSRGPVQVRLTVGLLVATSDVERAQRQLDTLIMDVRGVLSADRTLGGTVTSSHVMQVSGHDEFEIGQVPLLGCRLDLVAVLPEV